MATKTVNSPAAAVNDLQYVLVRSRRKTLSLIVQSDGALEIRCPLNYPRRYIDHFVTSKIDWIKKKRQENQQTILVQALSAAQQIQAGQQLRNRFEQLAAVFTPKQAANLVIRDQKSRWGSCSSRGRISINSRCGKLPDELIEYVIFHELCHLIHLNHSPDFWQLLESYLPDAKKRRRTLNDYRLL